MSRNKSLAIVAGMVSALIAAVSIGNYIGHRQERAAIAAWDLPRYVDICNEPVIAGWDIVPTIYNDNPIDFTRRIMEPIDYYVGVPLGAPCRGTIGWADAELFGPCPHLRLKDAPVSWCVNTDAQLAGRSDSFYVSNNGLQTVAGNDAYGAFRAALEAYADYLVFMRTWDKASSQDQRACYIGAFAEGLYRYSHLRRAFFTHLRDAYDEHAAMFNRGAADPRSCHSV